jgi:hypothetical protein
MKIRKLAIDSFTDPFANLLAIANLVMVALAGTFALFRTSPFIEVIRDLNAPAIVASVVLTRSMTSFILIPPLIYLQWIFIGGFAKFLAAKLKAR